MLGESGSGVTGRNDGASQRGTKKRKFVPTVRARQKRAEDSARVKPPDEQTASSETFSQLMQQAESEAKWDRGGGRRRPADQRKAQTVAFGALLSGSRPQGHVSKLESKAGPSVLDAGEEVKAEDERQLRPIKPAIDESLYYPTTLPLRRGRQEGKCVLEGESSDLGEDTARSLGQLTLGTDVENPARELGLIEQSTEEGHLLLLQLPTVLPVPGAKAQDHVERDARQQREQGSNCPDLPTAARVKDVPAGKIGKLLVYKSGRVKMMVGNVPMNVTCGTPWVYRQEVVAVNVGDVDGHCVFLGDVSRRAVCTPNIFQLLGSDPTANTQWTGGDV